VGSRIEYEWSLRQLDVEDPSGDLEVPLEVGQREADALPV
jgi:hypothetical protein